MGLKGVTQHSMRKMNSRSHYRQVVEMGIENLLNPTDSLTLTMSGQGRAQLGQTSSRLHGEGVVYPPDLPYFRVIGPLLRVLAHLQESNWGWCLHLERYH